jgi:hypothetical protein
VLAVTVETLLVERDPNGRFSLENEGRLQWIRRPKKCSVIPEELAQSLEVPGGTPVSLTGGETTCSLATGPVTAGTATGGR